MVDKRPAFITRCATSRDVTASVNPVAVASATLSVQP